MCVKLLETSLQQPLMMHYNLVLYYFCDLEAKLLQNNIFSKLRYSFTVSLTSLIPSTTTDLLALHNLDCGQSVNWLPSTILISLQLILSQTAGTDVHEAIL